MGLLDATTPCVLAISRLFRIEHSEFFKQGDVFVGKTTS